MRSLLFGLGCITLIVAGFGIASDSFAQGGGFQMPADHNTYVVTYDLRGLRCVKGVGTPSQCAVENQAADEGGYPWTKVKCKPGDKTVNKFAWSLDNNEAMGIFEAPTALLSDAKTYTINVRFGRTCLKSKPGKTGN